jgi:hypothetical protein
MDLKGTLLTEIVKSSAIREKKPAAPITWVFDIFFADGRVAKNNPAAKASPQHKVRA